jgi:hypothetical protein
MPIDINVRCVKEFFSIPRGTSMMLDRIAFRSFRRAYDAAVLAPGDAKAHDRFAKWARLVGRIVGLPITGCSETDSAGRDRGCA